MGLNTTINARALDARIEHRRHIHFTVDGVEPKRRRDMFPVLEACLKVGSNYLFKGGNFVPEPQTRIAICPLIVDGSDDHCALPRLSVDGAKSLPNKLLNARLPGL